MENLSSWILVIITFVYAVTTIVICVANLKSANATKKQTKEQIRQFNETNRPVVDVTLDTTSDSMPTALGFIFHNTGQKYARDIRVSVNGEFLEKIEINYAVHFRKLINSKFNLGIGQTHTIPFCEPGEQYDMGIVEIDVTYHNDEYSEKFTFDLGLDNTRFAVTSDLSKISTHLKKIADTTISK